ncbi:Na+/H+ antiporter NhaC family protein [Microbulbifer taiwanensis]
MVAKLSRALPTILLLFAIGLLIGSWIISGTIPMLMVYGVELVTPGQIYLFAFLVPAVFSLCTGTSWGSIGTAGVVIISIATVMGADLAIVCGAIVGGAYFGDKVSPLSDTTNIAALAVGVDVYQHIRSMLYTTLPAGLLAAGVFTALGHLRPPPAAGGYDNPLPLLTGIFDFHPLLLLPVLLVLVGSARRVPPLLVLVASTLLASLLAILVQKFSVDELVRTLHRGFDLSRIAEQQGIVFGEQPLLSALLDRGGLYALSEPAIIVILVFVYVGIIDRIGALSTVIQMLLRGVKRASALIAASLVASAVGNALTSSQYANSFIVGDALAEKYDRLGVPRRVLSRSLEDTGTMIESLVPWSTTSVFIFATLGVSVADYWHWQLLSLFNIAIAFLCAFTGFGCFLSWERDALPATSIEG